MFLLCGDGHFQEIFQKGWNSFPFGRAPLQLSGDVCRYNARPAVVGVKADDAEGRDIAALQSPRECRGPQAASASASIIAPSVSMPAARQNRSKDADTSSHALPTGAFGIAFVFMVDVFMALLSFRGISTPSLPAQGEQRRSS